MRLSLSDYAGEHLKGDDYDQVEIVVTGATGKPGSVVSTELLIDQSIPCPEH
jgi:hypothetical protein